jgi:hypothetical protein
VGAVLVVGRQPPDVKAAQRRDPIRVGRGDAPTDPPAHAVARDRERAAGRLLEPVEVGATVADDPLGRQLADQRHGLGKQPSLLLGVAQTVERDDGCATGPVEEVGGEDHVAAVGDPVGHPFDLRPQAVSVHHQQDAGTALVAGPRQVRVRDAVRRRHVDHLAGHRSTDNHFADVVTDKEAPVISAPLMIKRLATALRVALREEDFGRIMAAAVALIIVGTLACSIGSGWSVVDGLYVAWRRSRPRASSIRT